MCNTFLHSFSQRFQSVHNKYNTCLHTYIHAYIHTNKYTACVIPSFIRFSNGSKRRFISDNRCLSRRNSNCGTYGCMHVCMYVYVHVDVIPTVDHMVVYAIMKTSIHVCTCPHTNTHTHMHKPQHSFMPL